VRAVKFFPAHRRASLAQRFARAEIIRFVRFAKTSFMMFEFAANLAPKF